jgi:hypothetical protein
MPVRVFRILLSNNLGVPLLNGEPHLCHGDWTPGGWEPPATIPARSEVGWQSESGGIATGTEGWVKYKIGRIPQVIPGGTPPAAVPTETTVYIYWNNPFLSSPFTTQDYTRAKGSVTVGDVRADCDADDSGGSGSAFAPPPSGFDLLPEGVVPGRPLGPSGSDELLLDLPQVPFAPLIIIGTVGQIVEHAWGRFILRESGSVRQSLPLKYDTSHGLRKFKLNSAQTSVRAMFAF